MGEDSRPPPTKKSSAQPTLEDKAEAIKLRNKGWSQQRIAEKYGVNQCSVSRWLKDPTKHQVAAATNGSAHRVRASQYWIDNVLVPWKRQILPDEKAGLIFDNAPAHLDLKFPDDIVLMLLPPNVTCVHQPMDQGIISAFKRIYKTAILDTVDSLLPNWKQIREDGAKKPDGYRGLKDGYAVNMLDALELISTSWKQVSKETVVNCFIKANCLPPIHMNEIMKLTEKGLAKLAVSLTTTPTTNNVAPLMRANSAATAAGTAGEALEAVDTVDADLAATDQPTEDELGALIKKMDKIALTVTSSNDFVHANNHRHALLNEVVVAPAGIDKLKAVLEMLTIEDDPWQWIPAPTTTTIVTLTMSYTTQTQRRYSLRMRCRHLSSCQKDFWLPYVDTPQLKVPNTLGLS